MSRDEGEKERVKQNYRKEPLPREIHIPDDFEGIVQINVQSQKETETESITQSQSQNTTVAVAQLQAQVQAVAVQIQQLQNLMQPITVQVQQAQSQMQACSAQTAAQLQGLQSQLQLLFMAILGAPAGADAGERQQLLREIVTILRANPQ